MDIIELNDAEKQKWNFDLDYHGDKQGYIGINCLKIKYGNLKLTQQKLINQIISEVRVNIIIRTKRTPTPHTKIVYQDIKVETFDHSLNY